MVQHREVDPLCDAERRGARRDPRQSRAVDAVDQPEIRRLLGVEGKLGEGLGLTNDWAARIIRHVGNYGESFERTVGMGSPLKIARGVNALWSQGGLQYARRSADQPRSTSTARARRRTAARGSFFIWSTQPAQETGRGFCFGGIHT